jgi:hypothetical protein
VVAVLLDGIEVFDRKSPDWLKRMANVYFNPVLFIIFRCCFQTIGERSFLPANQLFPCTPKQQMKIQNV